MNNHHKMLIKHKKKNNFLKKISLIVIISIIISCGKWGWEPVTSDHESTLNVFALIFVGDSLSGESCYINVHQSLDLEQNEEIIAGNDTTWYGPDSLYDFYVTEITKSAYIVEDATVYITDGVDTTYFYHTPPQFLEDYGWVTLASYKDTLLKFRPRPNREYTLSVSTPDGRSASGKIKTPSVPHIYNEQVPDTLFNRRTFTIPFKPMTDDQHLRVKMHSINDYSWSCGANRIYVLQDVSDTTWTSKVKSCTNGFGYIDGGENTLTVSVALEAMDDNFYEYFIKNAGEVEYVNILTGIEGNSGFSAGIEGGYGVFGAIAVDKIERVYVP